MAPIASPVPRASVITRTKDRPELLDRALTSIADQTARDFEVIVVNDGGESSAVDELVARLQTRRPDVRVAVVHNPESHGRGGALVDGLGRVAADRFVVHDDDDTWEPDFLELTGAHLDAHPEEVGVATRTWVIREELIGGAYVEREREILDADLTAITLLGTARRNSVPTIALLIRADAAQRAGGYDEQLSTMEDWDLLVRLLADGPVGYILGEPHAHYHLRESSTGPVGNSVYLEQKGHRSSETRLRDAFIREGGSLGEVIAMASYVNELENRIDSLHLRISSFETAHSAHLEAVFDALGREDLKAQVDRLHSDLAELTEQIQRERRQRGLWSRVRARLARPRVSPPAAPGRPSSGGELAEPRLAEAEQRETVRPESAAGGGRSAQSTAAPDGLDPWHSNRWLDTTESTEK